MFEISQVIYNLQRYGNCTVYFYEPAYGNQNVNPVIEFYFDKNGDLVTRSTLEIYSVTSGPRWDGNKLNCINPIDVAPVLEEDRLKLETRIAAIIASEFSGVKVAVITKETLKTFMYSKEEIEKVYKIASRMVSNWSSKDFSNSIIGGHNVLIKTLLSKNNQELEEEEDYCFDYASALMDGKMASFLAKEKMTRKALMEMTEEENISR